MLNIASIVVTYNPDRSIRENIESLSRQSQEVVIVDNNSLSIEFMSNLPSNCTLLRCESNLGLAFALNLGILHALKKNFDAIATFDQDTLIPENYFIDMMKDLKFDSKSKIGILSPQYIDRATGVKKAFASRALNKNLQLESYNLTRSTMTSGSIMNPFAIMKGGLFRGEMFIDQLDNEICLRYRKAGYLILEHKWVAVEHSVGQNTERLFFKLRVLPSNHSALRRYYIARNRVFMYKKYTLFDIRWVLMDLRGFITETLKILLYEENKAEKIRMTAKGLRDGFKNSMGPIGI